MTDRHIRVIIVDDHPFIRYAIEVEIDKSPAMQVVGTASNANELDPLLTSVACDVLVADYAMPSGAVDGLDMLLQLREQYPEMHIVVMTGLDQPAVIRAIHAAGINQILSKADDPRLVTEAIQAASVNRRFLSPSISALLPPRSHSREVPALSPREQMVLTLLAQGMTVNQIAEQLGRRKQTISTQKVNVMAKLGLERDADLFKYAIEAGLGEKPAG